MPGSDGRRKAPEGAPKPALLRGAGGKFIPAATLCSERLRCCKVWAIRHTHTTHSPLHINTYLRLLACVLLVVPVALEHL